MVYLLICPVNSSQTAVKSRSALLNCLTNFQSGKHTKNAVESTQEVVYEGRYFELRSLRIRIMANEENSVYLSDAPNSPHLGESRGRAVVRVCLYQYSNLIAGSRTFPFERILD